MHNLDIIAGIEDVWLKQAAGDNLMVDFHSQTAREIQIIEQILNGRDIVYAEGIAI